MKCCFIFIIFGLFHLTVSLNNRNTTSLNGTFYFKYQKILTCMSLIRGRFNMDEANINKYVSQLNQVINTNSSLTHIFNYGLVQCYISINTHQMAYIITKNHENETNQISIEDEYKKLIGIEDLFDKTKPKLSAEIIKKKLDEINIILSKKYIEEPIFSNKTKEKVKEKHKSKKKTIINYSFLDIISGVLFLFVFFLVIWKVIKSIYNKPKVKEQ